MDNVVSFQWATIPEQTINRLSCSAYIIEDLILILFYVTIFTLSYFSQKNRLPLRCAYKLEVSKIISSDSVTSSRGVDRCCGFNWIIGYITGVGKMLLSCSQQRITLGSICISAIYHEGSNIKELGVFKN